MTRDLRKVGGSGGGKLGSGRDGARDIALFALLSALSALRASASRAMLGGSPVAALRKRVSCCLGGVLVVARGGGVLLAEGVHHGRRGPLLAQGSGLPRRPTAGHRGCWRGPGCAGLYGIGCRFWSGPVS